MDSSLPEPPFVLIDDARNPAAPCCLFSKPLKVVTAETPEDVPAALEAMETARGEGFFCAGFMSYELGYVLEAKLLPLLPEKRKMPLIWMGIFKDRREITSAQVAELLSRGTDEFTLSDLRPGLGRDEYIKAICRIRDAIAAGEVYQINYTFKYRFGFSGSAAALYGDLRRRQRAGHCAFIATGDFHVLSLSPELFFAVDNGHIRARPMKGTAGRAPDTERDNEQKAWLAADRKSRAENLMIVDLVRNDLGRVSEIGSVEVSGLFTIETYPTLHQMTSAVESRLKPQKKFGDLIAALFPCGSITGAPKVRAMEIIRQMETGPRGVYTGAIGWAGPGGPGGEAAFNVAIRTLVVDRNGRGEMGVGGGIVFDSEPAAEYDECLLKARFLTETIAPFSLIETMRLENGTFYLLDRHIRRLGNSAEFFGFPFDGCDIRRRLADEAEKLNGGMHRVRLSIDENGETDITSAPLAAETGKTEWTFTVSSLPADRRSPFTFHKTTRRKFYDRERAAGNGDEVVFLNDRGEITEGSMTNIFIELNGRLLTPGVDCGLLAGTFRQDFLDRGKAREAVLTLEDMAKAERIFLANSVRGLIPARRIFPADRA